MNAFAEILSNAQDEAAQNALRAAEEEEKAKFHGTPVTVETFVKWRIRFEEELQDQLGVKVQVLSNKVTGKQMFLQVGLLNDPVPYGRIFHVIRQ